MRDLSLGLCCFRYLIIVGGIYVQAWDQGPVLKKFREQQEIKLKYSQLYQAYVSCATFAAIDFMLWRT